MKVDTAASFGPLVITACGDWGTIATVELTDLALNHAKKCDEDSSSESGCAIEGRGSPAWNLLDCSSHRYNTRCYRQPQSTQIILQKCQTSESPLRSAGPCGRACAGAAAAAGTTDRLRVRGCRAAEEQAPQFSFVPPLPLSVIG